MKTTQFRELTVFYSLVTLAAVLLPFARFPLRAGDTSSWGFAPSNLDRSCKPCDDFYQFAMGGWMKSNPIPPQYSSWGTFTQLHDNNLAALRGILETVAKASAPAGSNEQKIGDFYASCMNTAAIEAAWPTQMVTMSGRMNAIVSRIASPAVIDPPGELM